MTPTPETARLRIVTFNNLPIAFRMTQQWAAEAGHEVVLVVTSPGPKTRRTDGYREIAGLAGEQNLELLSTTRMKSVVLPVLRTLKPDLIVSFSFPWLLPPELFATARLGAVNMHPALLPAYRGPNVLRQFYDAAPEIGATLHWMDAAFDTGRILSQHRAPLPQACTSEAMFGVWGPTIMAAMTEGVARAIAGDPGTAQSEHGASYAAPFTEQEHWLDLNDTAFALQCKTSALHGAGHAPMIRLGQTERHVVRVDLGDDQSHEAAGEILDSTADAVTDQTRVGVAHIVLEPLHK
jgi:methionyl-tRNA formyltransferase